MDFSVFFKLGTVIAAAAVGVRVFEFGGKVVFLENNSGENSDNEGFDDVIEVHVDL